MHIEETMNRETTADTRTRPFEVDDPDFCLSCGSILPLADPSSNLVLCRLCKRSYDINEWNGRTFLNNYKIHSFNANDSDESGGLVKSQGLRSEDFQGALAKDRKCGKCGHEGMTYSTRQTRSADEGQTVFFSCPKCKSQEIEYS